MAAEVVPCTLRNTGAVEVGAGARPAMTKKKAGSPSKDLPASEAGCASPGCKPRPARRNNDQKRWRMPTVTPVRLRAPLLSSAMPAPPFTRV